MLQKFRVNSLRQGTKQEEVSTAVSRNGQGMYNHGWGMHARKELKTAQSCYENWNKLKGNAVASPLLFTSGTSPQSYFI